MSMWAKRGNAGTNQIQRLMEEKKFVEEELRALQAAKPPEEASKEIIQYCQEEKEPLESPGDNPWIDHENVCAKCMPCCMK